MHYGHRRLGEPGVHNVKSGFDSQRFGKIFGLVVNRRKARRTIHESPTVSDPESIASHHDLAAAWSGASLSTA
jgi:hypothetical protein